MFRIGVMGAGVVADFGHLPAIRSTPGLELAAIYDPLGNRAVILAEKYGTFGTTSQEAFFDQKLDAVVIASPPAAHPANAVAAAKHGAIILCEKPLASDEALAEAMIREVRALGSQIYTGFVYRFSPVSEQIRTWVREGIVGEIRDLRLIYLCNLHGQYEAGADGWHESPRWRGRMVVGGPLVDCGVHQIDLARWWLGSEVVDWSTAAAWVSDYDAPDHQYLHMHHANGARTCVEMSFTYGHTAENPRSVFTYELIGTGGVIRLDRDGYVLEARHGRGITTAPGASEKNFEGMYLALRETLESPGSSRLPSAEDGLAATSIAEAAVRQVVQHNTKRLQNVK